MYKVTIQNKHRKRSVVYPSKAKAERVIKFNKKMDKAFGLKNSYSIKKVKKK